MKVNFRADAGAKGLGMGHLVRSFSLAGELLLRGHQVQFICKEFDATARGFLENTDLGNGAAKGRFLAPIFLKASASLEEEIAACKAADLLVVDSYDISEKYLSALAEHLPLVLVSDYLLEFKLPVSLLLNPQAEAQKLEYKISKDTKFLAGPEYFLFRRQFREVSKKTYRPALKNMLVCFGGSDDCNLTELAVKELAGDFNGKLKVVLGLAYSKEREDCLTGLYPDLDIVRNISNMKECLESADLLICTPSTICCESARVGLPSISILSAENQKAVASLVQSSGSGKYLGPWNVLKAGDILNSVKELDADCDLRRSMGEAGRQLYDGKGVQRVANAIEGIC